MDSELIYHLIVSWFVRKKAENIPQTLSSVRGS